MNMDEGTLEKAHMETQQCILEIFGVMCGTNVNIIIFNSVRWPKSAAQNKGF